MLHRQHRVFIALLTPGVDMSDVKLSRPPLLPSSPVCFSFSGDGFQGLWCPEKPGDPIKNVTQMRHNHHIASGIHQWRHRVFPCIFCHPPIPPSPYIFPVPHGDGTAGAVLLTPVRLLSLPVGQALDMLKNGVFCSSGTSSARMQSIISCIPPSVGYSTHTTVARQPDHQYQDNDPSACQGPI